MKSKHFYTFQVVTGNLARIINSIGQYEMMLESLEKGEEQKKVASKSYTVDADVQLKISEIKSEVAILEESKRVYITIKNKIEDKYFSKYYEPKEGWIRKMNDWVLKIVKFLKIK